MDMDNHEKRCEIAEARAADVQRVAVMIAEEMAHRIADVSPGRSDDLLKMGQAVLNLANAADKIRPGVQL